MTKTYRHYLAERKRAEHRTSGTTFSRRAHSVAGEMGGTSPAFRRR